MNRGKRNCIVSVLLILALTLSLGVTSQAAIKYKTYKNKAYSYTLKYPSYMKEVNKENAVPSGIDLAGKKATLSIFASDMDDLTPKMILHLSTENMKTTKEKAGKNYCYFYYKAGSTRGYMYVYFLPAKNKIIGYRLEYPKSKKSTYEAVIKKMTKSLKKNK